MADRYDHEMLLAYLEGELTPEQLVRFETRLAKDTQFRKLVDGLAADRHALRNLPAEDPPSALAEDVIQQLERQMLLGDPADEPIPIETAPKPPRRHRVLKTLSYSGLAALVLLSGGLIVLTLMDTNAIQTAQQLARIGEAERGDQPAVALRSSEPESADEAAPRPDAAPDTLAPPMRRGLTLGESSFEAHDSDAPSEPTVAATIPESDAAADAPSDSFIETRLPWLATLDRPGAEATSPGGAFAEADSITGFALRPPRTWRVDDPADGFANVPGEPAGATLATSSPASGWPQPIVGDAVAADPLETLSLSLTSRLFADDELVLLPDAPALAAIATPTEGEEQEAVRLNTASTLTSQSLRLVSDDPAEGGLSLLAWESLLRPSPLRLLQRLMPEPLVDVESGTVPAAPADTEETSE